MINLEATGIILSIDRHEIKIIAAYNPPNKRIQSKSISKLFKEKPTILLGEIN